MSYLLLEDTIADNPKILELSDKAFRLYIYSLVYCSTNLTDGAISEIALVTNAAKTKIRRHKIVARQLVDAGLWEVNGSGWKVHDYLDYNPSREHISQKRALTRKRQARFRDTNVTRDVTRDVTRHVTRGKTHIEELPAKLVGSSAKRSPKRAASLKTKQTTLDEAIRLAQTWDPELGGSDVYHEHLDELERQHGVKFTDRERNVLIDAFVNRERPPDTPNPVFGI